MVDKVGRRTSSVVSVGITLFRQAAATMSDVSPVDDEKNIRDGEAKEDIDIQSVPVYDDAGPVEFAEKAELRLVLPNGQQGTD